MTMIPGAPAIRLDAESHVEVHAVDKLMKLAAALWRDIGKL